MHIRYWIDNAKVNAEIERRWLDFGSDALIAEHQQATEKQDKRREVSNDRLPNDMNWTSFPAAFAPSE